MIAESYNSNIVCANFTKPEVVSVPASGEAQPISLFKQFSSNSHCLFFLLLIVLTMSTPPLAWAEDASIIELTMVQLTAEEKAWLDKNYMVQVRVTDFPPFIITKEGKEPSGISIEYLNLVAKRTGITFKFNHSTLPLSQDLEKMQNREGPDLIPNMMRTPSLEKNLSFSKGYSSIPMVVFTRTDESLIAGMDDLSGKTIAVSRGTFIHKQVQARYPGINLLLLGTDLESLKALATGKVDAYIGNLALASYFIMQNEFTNLKVAAPSPFGDDVLSCGNRKDWPELATIITKVLESITAEEKNQIREKYVSLYYENGFAIKDLLKWIVFVAGVFTGVVLFFLVWNKQLSRKVRTRTAQLSESEAKYRNLVDNSIVGVFSTTMDGRFVFVNDALAKMYDFDNAKMLMAQGTLARWVDLERREQMLNTLKKDGRVTNFEAETITNTGRHIYVLFSAKLIGDKIYGMLMDVSDIHHARAALETSEANLVRAQEVARIGSWDLDLIKGNLVWSDENYKIFGVPKGTPLTYKKFLKVVHPEDRDYVSKQWNAALGGEKYDIEHRLLVDNEVKWVREKAELRLNDTGTPINGVGITQDITKEKLAQIEIEKSFADIKKLKKLLEEESSYLRKEISIEHNYENIIGNSDALKYVLFKVEQVCESDTNVLILGETGTGKELIARAIHHNSQRHNRPLIKVNCATLPSHLIESELFGHERGSFTSANSMLKGRFEIANGSSIFLDEIGELPLELQAKLLRVLEEGEFERLGSTKTIKVDVRIIAATNRDLEQDVSEGRFRQDLWYRLNVFPVTIPPLRERIEDVPLIVQYYLDQFNKKQGKHITSIPVKIMKAMQNYSWPGNVRELVNIVERAVVSTSGSKLRLAEELKRNHHTSPEEFKSLHDMERDYIIKVLEKTHWKVSGEGSAAEILGLNRGTLRAKMKKMNIHKS